MKHRVAAGLATLVFAAGLSAPLGARELELAKVPLFLASAVKPNVLITFDDSGSMRESFMPEQTDSRDVVWNNTTLCGFQAPSFFSSSRNAIYFDPAVTYEPPLNHDGTRLPDVDFHAAPIDGLRAFARLSDATVLPVPVVDLATNYFPTFQLNFDVYGNPLHRTMQHVANPVYPGTPGANSRCNAPVGTDTSTRLPFAVATASGVTSEAFYYELAGANPNDESAYTARKVSQAQRQNFANWYSYYRTRSLLARSAIADTFAPIGDSFRTDWQGLNQDWFDDDSIIQSFSSAHKQAFYRFLFVWRATGETPLRAATQRVGEFYKRAGLTPASPYFDAGSGMELSCRANFHLLITDGYWNEENPLADVSGSGLAQSIGGFPIGSPSPVGFPYVPGADIESRIYWNQLAPSPATLYTSTGPRCHSPTSSGPGPCDPSLADLAFHYWASDLRPDLEDRVPRRWDDLEVGALDATPDVTTSLGSSALAMTSKEAFFNPKNDPANWQHMVNYVIGMGLAGIRNFPNDYGALRRGVAAWPWVRNASARGVDDAWRAALASRGEYMLANNGEQLRTALNRTLLNIEKHAGSVSATALTSGVVSESSFAIRTSFDTGDWSGEVQAFPVTASGVGADPVWSAAGQLSMRSPGSRVVFTSATAAGDGKPFTWAALAGSDWQARLDDDPLDPGADPDGLGEARLNYLRGDDTQEAKQGGPFRDRVSELGAIIHSSAVVVGAPSGGFRDDTFPDGSPEAEAALDGQGYADFRASVQRDRVAYVASNDGMLHAFDAGSQTDPGTGAELWAYVPHRIASIVGRITLTAAPFEPTVDSTPSVRDMFVGGKWRTVLVGNLRRGGQGIYALDITTPQLAQSASDADRLVLWEFSDELTPTVPEAARLGYTYGKPNLVRLENGRWVVLLPGGYNNEEADGNAGDGSASLFVLSIDDGSLVREINLPSSFGLAFSTTGDLDGNGSDEFAVAGDALGNLWYFDLAGADPASWSARKLFAGAPGNGPIEANPISSAARVFGDPATGGAIAVFGTGKLVEPADRLIEPGAQPQRVIAVRFDPAAPAALPATLADLTQKQIGKVLDGDTRHYTISPAPPPANSKGWFFDLPEAGEKVINAPGALFSHGLVMINSVRPSGGDPCQGALGGNFFILDASTGSAPNLGAMFDTDGDGQVTDSDASEAIGIGLVRSLAEGTPTFVAAPGGGSAHIADFPTIRVPDPVWRRRAWREIRK